MMFSMLGCGSNAVSETDQKQQLIDKLKKQNEELKEENEKLKAQLSDDSIIKKEDVVTSDTEEENWDDDMVITFTDEKFNKKIRKVIGMPNGNVTYGMIKDIRELKFVPAAKSYSSIKYFTGLKKLTAKDIRCQEDVDEILTLKGLEELEITCYSDTIIDVSNIKELTNLRNLTMENFINSESLGNLTNLEKLNISNSEHADLTSISNLTNLKDLHITDDSLENLSFVTNMTDLEKLYVSSTKLSNISAVGDLNKLKQFLIRKTPNIDDFSVLSNMTSLEFFEIQNDYYSYNYNEWDGGGCLEIGDNWIDMSLDEFILTIKE